jgi:hypothetical protein
VLILSLAEIQETERAVRKIAERYVTKKLGAPEAW